MTNTRTLAAAETAEVVAFRSGDAREGAPEAKHGGAAARKPRKRKRVSPFWLKQLHSWHWISAAVSLVAMLLFSVTGITLNHAASIPAEPVVVAKDAVLPGSLLRLMEGADDEPAPLPPRVAQEVKELVGIDAAGVTAEWSPDEAYVAIPGPGRDAWVSIDRNTGDILSERTDRGWVSFINDLHKGRNTGTAWFWFIDVFAAACIIFTITGLLLLQLHARSRPSTWPIVGLGILIPVVIIVLFMHS